MRYFRLLLLITHIMYLKSSTIFQNRSIINHKVKTQTHEPHPRRCVHSILLAHLQKKIAKD